MDVKEFAEIYGMSVSDLAEYTGYSRKTLYNIFSSTSGCNDRRLRAMIRQLRAKAMNDLTKEKEAADKRYMERLQALEIIRLENQLKWKGAQDEKDKDCESGNTGFSGVYSS